MAAHAAEIVLDRTHSSSLNLAVLQRLDPQIDSIVASASHAVVYKLDNADQTWVKKNIEGALFVVQRSQAPRYQLVVMNRLSRTNLVQNIGATLDLQVIKPYLMFRDTSHPELGVHGLWFHDDADRKTITAQLDRLRKKEATVAATGEEKPSEISKTVGATDAGKALLSMIGGSRSSTMNATSGNVAASSNTSATNNGATRVENDAGATGGDANMAGRRNRGTTPGAGNASTNTAPNVPPSPQLGEVNIVLTRKQLQTVLLDMLHDDEFVRQLHLRYLESVTRQAST